MAEAVDLKTEMNQLIRGYWTTQAIFVVAELRIADMLADGPQHPDELGKEAGVKGDLPLVGEWGVNGAATIGVYRPSESVFYLRNSNTPGIADIAAGYGTKGDIPLVGDWDGDGTVTIGVYRPSDSTFYLRNSNTPGYADYYLRRLIK